MTKGRFSSRKHDILGGTSSTGRPSKRPRPRAEPVQFDLIAGSLIKVKHTLPNAERSQMVRYN